MRRGSACSRSLQHPMQSPYRRSGERVRSVMKRVAQRIPGFAKPKSAGRQARGLARRRGLNPLTSQQTRQRVPRARPDTAGKCPRAVRPRCAEALRAAACSAHGARNVLRVAPTNEHEAADEDRCPDDHQGGITSGASPEKGSEIRHALRGSCCLPEGWSVSNQHAASYPVGDPIQPLERQRYDDLMSDGSDPYDHVGGSYGR